MSGSSSLLELTRSTHEEIERLQKAILDELNPEKTPKNYKENVVQTTRIKLYLDRSAEARSRLAEYYEDKDGLRREEIASMSGQGPDVYKIFYDRIRDLKEYHRRFPEQEVQRLEEAIKAVPDEQLLPSFTSEEAYGRSLDLTDFFERYRNLALFRASPAGKDPLQYDFLSYLRDLRKFNDNLALKDADYRGYIADLLAYFESFLERAQPLLDVAAELRAIDAEFDQRWQSGEFSGWSTAADVAAAELQQRKEAAAAIDDTDEPLYCKTCDKRFAKESVFQAHMASKKHLAAVQRATAAAGAGGGGGATAAAGAGGKKAREQQRELYRSEARIVALCSKQLAEPLENTRINYEKRLARNAAERAHERIDLLDGADDGAAGAAADDDDDDLAGGPDQPEVRLTIANYPVGWDGKPIPYWLYKLHGLGVEYRCEICGNQSYWGRKAYEKHFQEFRHAYGMRCLGIPNSRHFHDITKINDALILWDKLKKDQAKSKFKTDNEEEFEDREGNVFSKKTYEDLRRQGLWA